MTCAYDGREFVRVGYYVNNEYDSEELNAEPPTKPIIERVKRNVLAEKPRVTRFAIKWYVIQPLNDIDRKCSNLFDTGIPKHLHPPSSLLSSLKPISSPMVKNTEPKRPRRKLLN